MFTENNVMPTNIFKFCWFFLKKYKWMLAVYCLIETTANISLYFGSSFILKSIISRADNYASTQTIDVAQITEINSPTQTINIAQTTGTNDSDIHTSTQTISINSNTLTLIVAVAYVLSLCFLSVAYDAVWVAKRLILFKSSFIASLDALDMLLSHCLNHSVGYFNERLSGDLSNKINTVVEYVNRGVIRGASCYILFFVVYPLNTFFLFRITKSIPLLIFNIVWITSFYVVIFYISKISSELSKTEAENKSVASGIIIDCFTNISNVKIFASERKEFWTIKKQNKKILQSSLSIIKVRNIEYITIYIFMTSFIFIVNFVCFKRLLDKQILLDTFVFINSQIISMCYNANWALNNFCRFNRVTSSIKNAMNTILEPIVIKDKDDAIDMEKTQGRIIFKNISFNYKQQEATMCEEKNKMVFDNFSLEIDPGTKVGIVGYSGAGKSTLVNLLLRFFDVEEGNGSIEIDGYDLRDITQKSLRNNISYIPQEAILFHRSIKENIIYGKPNATEEEFMEASKKACCHEFIMQLKDNYNTLVGERGAKLSGGQRQRIAIARAILKNSPILILDEATSALDSITEKEVRTALENSMKNKTVIAVAHRLSTLNNMDRIVVLDKGKIVEDGTQKELLQIRDGLFSRMWNMQQNGIIE